MYLATSLGNQVKHSIVDYMRFIYDFPRCHYEMFPLDFVLLSFLFDLLLLFVWVISYRSIGSPLPLAPQFCRISALTLLLSNFSMCNFFFFFFFYQLATFNCSEKYFQQKKREKNAKILSIVVVFYYVVRVVGGGGTALGTLQQFLLYFVFCCCH